MAESVVIRVLIIEDEPPARAKLRRLLEPYPQYRIVAEAGDVAAGLVALREHTPDLLFLDIRLGADNGFDVITRSAPPHPLIVFTTACHEHAVQAFEVAALDYLLKPFDAIRFARMLHRVNDRLAEQREEHDERNSAGAERLRKAGALLAGSRLSRVVVHDRGRSLIVPVTEVHRFAASGNYLEVHTDARVHLIRATLARLAQRLDPIEFLRVHRAHLVRADFIAAVAPLAHGDLKLTLRDGSEVPMSRRYRSLLPDDWLKGTIS